ncbi:adenylate/guanylate cyclase domain-containing protein [Thermospira aquatica]|uniref:Adenylate/guanylate cyclase domain-containing protein n=1 Tax=Thermospira aquatica TaxID=2828656 RepID=A0AAX3BC29_9SPIR|nr:adenylate/guanylate cyclase domain-containing protein [Thermospira aquatica]URA09868.1 adenylate/guanylate cyclase domain-containing protein [Thermospira aquatica]
MKKIKKFFKYFIIIGLGISFVVLSSVLYYGENKSINAFFKGFEDRTIHWRFQSRYKLASWFNKKHQSNILDRLVIVAIDDKAIAKYGGSFPFDRQVWADYLNYLNSLPERKKPQLVFFDIVFSDPSRNPTSDTNLIKAFQAYQGKLAIDFILELSQAAVNLNAEDPYFHKLVQRDALPYDSPYVQSMRIFEFPGSPPYEKVSHYTKQVLVLPSLIQSVDATGSANFFSDNASVYRFFPAVISSFYKKTSESNSLSDITNVYYPSIHLSLFLSLVNANISNVVWTPEGIRITNVVFQQSAREIFIPFIPRTRGYIGINYLAPSGKGEIKVVSLADIKKTSLPQDAILLTGMYSRSGTHDIWRSPVGEMYGIEHIAYALYTMYENRFLKYLPVWVEILYMVLLVMIVGVLAARGKLVSLTFGAMFSFLPFGIGLGGFFGDWSIITFLPFLNSVLVLLFGQIYVLITESKEKSFIRQTFSSYLNPKLVDLLIERPDILQLGGSEREITIFFSSIKNFHEITEGFSAPQIVEFLNRYFGFMGDMVIEANGTLDKYMGEMIMAFWGAPLDEPQHAFLACQTALAMLEKVKLFNEEQKKLGLKPVVVNIGLNTGKAVVGNVGSDKQKNYTAIGDSVNLASRIKGLNKFYHTQIIISEFTYAHVKDKVIVRELDLTRVKGKSEPVRVYELWDLK